MRRSAVISECRRYRYRLTREWSAGPMLTFVMLNPSIADASVDDPTIRRCIAFAKRSGAHGLLVINLFALRATDPTKLKESEILAYGPDNYSTTRDVLRDAGRLAPVVCAWGAHSFAGDAANAFVQHAEYHGVALFCLGKTKNGSPRHPLYVRANQPFEEFP
jgi:hypothetical protein